MRRSAAIMYHSVGLENLPWCFGHITLPIHDFAECMVALQRKRYGSVFFKDHIPGQLHGRREVVLTFDDGYLDNWVHVHPILQACGLKGTVFVNPDFADPREIVRPQSNDLGELRIRPKVVLHQSDECCAGFLSWPEMRAMEASGCMDIQSHSLTHTWYPKGPQVVDFWRPGSATDPAGHVWMLWNRFPERKPLYLTECLAMEAEIPYGTPIYENGKALVTRRYFPSDELDRILPDFVHEHGGIELFQHSGWRERLFKVLDTARAGIQQGSLGRFETEDEYWLRVRYELSESKRILEERLGKRVNSICWPGGGVNEQVVGLAREIGYERFTLPSAWAQARSQGEFVDLSPRMGAGMQLLVGGKCVGKRTPTEFLWRVEAFAGSTPHRVANKAAVVARLGWHRLLGAG